MSASWQGKETDGEKEKAESARHDEPDLQKKKKKTTKKKKLAEREDYLDIEGV